MFICNVSGSVDMATRNKYTNGAYTRSVHIKIRREIGLRSRHRLISGKFSLYLLHWISNSLAITASLLLYRLFYVHYKLERKWHIKLYNALKTKRPVGVWKICCCIHILAGIYCISIVFHKVLVLNGSLQYVKCAPYAQIRQIFLLFSMIWYWRVQSPAVSKRQDVRWCDFRWSIPLSIDYV